MPENAAVMVNNVYDIAAAIFLILLIIAVVRQKDRNMEKFYIVAGMLILLAGLALKVMARTLLEGIIFTDQLYDVIYISGLEPVIMASSNVLMSLSTGCFFFYVTGSSIEKVRRARLEAAAAIQPFFTAAMIMMYAISPAGRYWTWIIGCQLIFGLVLCVRKRDVRTGIRSVFFPVVMPFIACILTYLIDKVALVGFGLVLMYQILYINYQDDIENELLQRELELSESRLRLLTQQISPHFIFNSLQVIQNMCDERPGEVKASIMHFADYLRSNLESLTEDRMIPFSRELANTEEYIYLEQIGRDRNFEVRYSIGISEFMIPPLVLQPVVENAVRYGIGTRAEGGVIEISTEEETRFIVIRVTDDGRGADSTTPHQKSRKSIGLENVRARLHAQCMGSLSIVSSDEGTTVTIKIPKQ